jgi:hypothetical protein
MMVLNFSILAHIRIAWLILHPCYVDLSLLQVGSLIRKPPITQSRWPWCCHSIRAPRTLIVRKREQTLINHIKLRELLDSHPWVQQEYIETCGQVDLNQKQQEDETTCLWSSMSPLWPPTAATSFLPASTWTNVPEGRSSVFSPRKHRGSFTQESAPLFQHCVDRK